MEFCKAFNAQTQADVGTIIPVEITVFKGPLVDFHHQDAARSRADQPGDRSREGLRRAGPDNVGTISRDQVRQIAETKLPDLNAHDVDQAMKIIEGTARSMGVDGHENHGKRTGSCVTCRPRT